MTQTFPYTYLHFIAVAERIIKLSSRPWKPLETMLGSNYHFSSKERKYLLGKLYFPAVESAGIYRTKCSYALVSANPFNSQLIAAQLLYEVFKLLPFHSLTRQILLPLNTDLRYEAATAYWQFIQLEKAYVTLKLEIKAINSAKQHFKALLTWVDPKLFFPKELTPSCNEPSCSCDGN